MPFWAEIWVIRFLQKKYLPTWLILVLDLILVINAYFFSLLLLTNFSFQITLSSQSISELILIGSCYSLAFVVNRTYIGAFRHTGVKDLLRLAYATVLAAVLVFFAFHLLVNMSVLERKTLTIAMIFLHAATFFMSVSGMRLFVKLMYSRYVLGKTRRNVSGIIIYGAGATGIAVNNAMKQDRSSYKEVVAYIDDNDKMQGKSIDGVPVVSFEKGFSDEFIKSRKVDGIVWSIQRIDSNRFSEVADKCIDLGLDFQRVPKIQEWIDGNISGSQLRKVKIEELLNRAEISLDNDWLKQFIGGKNILVTGAAGSIGSELCRQILYYRPRLLIMMDNGETAMHDMVLELSKSKYYENNVVFVVGDVTRANRVEEVFQLYQPNAVFHAAAYKHVPMMEANAKEAVRVNVEGTRVVAELAVKYQAEKFVFISTDKAVNPTNVMGATKRAAEMLVQLVSTKGKTQFITTRFGNVLGSNGSVIPLFRKQLENRQNLTVTHRDVVRYFMTIPEACQLVFQAATLGNGGEIFVFDMGEPVKIYDLAVKMIKLSGLTPGRDIDIVETGLRPGEKLFEELLSDKENTLPTPHPKIMVAKVEAMKITDVKKQLDTLCYQASNGASDMELVGTLKGLVPEFKSQNSVYSQLD